MLIPRLYAILDTSCFPSGDSIFVAAEELVAAGVTLLQYRNKSGNARRMLADARELKRRVGRRAGMPAPHGIRLIMNDRVDLCIAAEFDGVHLGQDDLSVEAARRILSSSAAKAAVECWTDGRPEGHPLQSQTEANTLSQPETTAQNQDQALGQNHERISRAHQMSRGYWIGVSTHNPGQLVEADKTAADYLAIGPVFATSSKANPDPVVGLEGVRRARELTRKPLVAIGGITRANARSVIEAGADAVAVISDLVTNPGKSAEEFLRVLG